jgi:PII-like signaling protein
MSLTETAMSLRIFIGEKSRHEGKPIYEAIILKAREAKLAGATVFRSPMGFGHSSLLHTANILRLSEDLPLVVEIIDSTQKVSDFLPVLEGMVDHGLITLQDITIVKYGNPEEKK